MINQPHLNLGHEGVDGGGQLLNLLAHLLLTLFQTAHSLIKLFHSLLQILNLYQTVNTARQQKIRIGQKETK